MCTQTSEKASMSHLVKTHIHTRNTLVAGVGSSHAKGHANVFQCRSAAAVGVSQADGEALLLSDGWQTGGRRFQQSVDDKSQSAVTVWEGEGECVKDASSASDQI